MKDANVKAKTYTLDIGGEVFRGTAAEIVKAMQTGAFFDRDLPLTAYLDKLPAQIRRLANVDVTLAGATVDERAESLIRELLRVGLAIEAT